MFSKDKTDAVRRLDMAFGNPKKRYGHPTYDLKVEEPFFYIVWDKEKGEYITKSVEEVEGKKE